MATLTSTASNSILDWLLNGTAAATGQRWLALDTDGSDTEVTDGSYARYDLAAAVPASASGAITSDAAISANVGTQTATHFRVVTTSNSSTSVTLVNGSLGTSKTGAFSVAIGDITTTCRAG
jgi:hypothetical protein